MKKRSVELSVGIFVLIGLVCIAYLTIRLGKLEVIGGEYYNLKARFSNVSGLKSGGIVDMAGVQVGTITNITLDYENLVAIGKDQFLCVYHVSVSSLYCKFIVQLVVFSWHRC